MFVHPSHALRHKNRIIYLSFFEKNSIWIQTVTQIWIRIIVGFVHFVVKNIERGKVVRHMRHFDMIGGNYVINVTTLILNLERDVNLHFMTLKSYKFTKESTQESFHLSAVIAVQDIYPRQHWYNMKRPS